MADLSKTIIPTLNTLHDTVYTPQTRLPPGTRRQFLTDKIQQFVGNTPDNYPPNYPNRTTRYRPKRLTSTRHLARLSIQPDSVGLNLNAKKRKILSDNKRFDTMTNEEQKQLHTDKTRYIKSMTAKRRKELESNEKNLEDQDRTYNFLKKYDPFLKHHIDEGLPVTADMGIVHENYIPYKKMRTRPFDPKEFDKDLFDAYAEDNAISELSKEELDDLLPRFRKYGGKKHTRRHRRSKQFK